MLWGSRSTAAPRQFRAAVIAFGVLTLGADARQLDCPSFPVDASDGRAYGPRDGYCEGRYLGQVAATPLAVASLTAGLARLDPKGGRIVASWHREAGQPVTLEVRALSRIYYRLDAVRRDADELRWPVDAVVSAGVSPTAIGAVAWSGEPTHRTLLPVRLSQERAPDPEVHNELVLLPAVDFESISVTVTRVQPPAKRPLRDREAVPGFRFPAHIPVRVSLRELDKEASPATFRIELRGRLLDRRGAVVSSVTVQHPGALPKP